MNEPLNIKLSNLEEYESGNNDGVWLKLPADGGQLDDALARIGAAGGEHGMDYFITGVESPVPEFAGLPMENLRRAGIDELNYIAGQFEKMDIRQTDKLIASLGTLANGGDPYRMAESLKGNGFFEHISGVMSYEQLGKHYLSSDRVRMPEEWKAAVDVNKLGQLAAAHEQGVFTHYGYIIPAGNFREAFAEIPDDYKIEQNRMYDDAPGSNIATRGNARMSESCAAVSAAPASTASPVKSPPRDKLKEILVNLEQGIKGVFDSEKYKDFLHTLSKFHNYSYANCVLIAMQKPEASYVAGFNSWQDNFNRHVKKGEKGIRILAPSPYKSKRDLEKTDKSGKPVLDKNGKQVMEQVEVTVPSFKAVSVFDVSQTYGEPLPKIGISELDGSVDKYKDFFAALEKASPVPVAFEPITTGAKGYYSQTDKRIALNEGMGELQNMKTLIHEIAHSRLHDKDANTPDAAKRPDRRTREIEAESIAYTVCSHYGLDTSEYSFGYIAEWSGDKQLDALKASLGTIRREASAIISDVDKHFKELTQDKEQGAERTAPETAKEQEKPAAAPERKNGISPVTEDPAQGGNVAAIEARANAGEVISLADLSDAIKKDNQAAKPGLDGKPGKADADKTSKKGAQSAAPNKAPGKGAAAKAEQPSIKEQLTAGKKQLAEQKPAPSRAAAKSKSNTLEV